MVAWLGQAFAAEGLISGHTLGPAFASIRSWIEWDFFTDLYIAMSNGVGLLFCGLMVCYQWWMLNPMIMIGRLPSGNAGS